MRGEDTSDDDVRLCKQTKAHGVLEVLENVSRVVTASRVGLYAYYPLRGYGGEGGGWADL